MRIKFWLCLLGIVFLLTPFTAPRAEVIQIDLTEFYYDGTVSVATDGSSATMAEDQDLSTVLLSNDPYFGDPGINVPPNLLTLNFTYNFEEGTSDEDEFYAWVFDGNTGGLLADFLVDSTSSGTVTWDLSSIDPTINLLGLEFQLNSFDSAYDSTLEISDVCLNTAPAPVPEPATIFLLGSGLVGLLGSTRKKLLKRG